MRNHKALGAWLTRARRVGSHPQAGLAVLCAVVAFALAACAAANSPQVVSLNRSSGGHKSVGIRTTPLGGGSPTQLLNEWAACMRTHGDPNQADPSVDANKDIHISWDPAIPGGYNGTQKGGQGNVGPGQYCRNYLNQAQSALGGGLAQNVPSQAQILKLAQCMRANGISDFPDSVNGTLSFNIGAVGDLNPNNPTFQSASRICSKRTGVAVPGSGGSPPPGTIELNGGGPVSGASAGGNG
jgi:hypothetical protein